MATSAERGKRRTTALPAGIVSFVLTDIVGSSHLWEADTAAMSEALTLHDQLVDHVVETHRGLVLKHRGEGDATFSVFTTASDAARAALAIQDAMAETAWTTAEPIEVRLGIHTGEAEIRGGDYYGPAVNRAARIRGAADAGEVLCSKVTADLIVDHLDPAVRLRELGPRHLRGMSRTEVLYSLEHGQGRAAADDLRVVVVDDHPLWRQTLGSVLAASGIAKVIGEAGSGAEAIAAVERLAPDVVMMDLDMPGMGGIDAAAAITSQHPTTRVLVLSSVKERPVVLAAVRAGASGYLIKTATPDEIADALARVARGELALPADLSAVVLEELRRGSNTPPTDGLSALTDRERDILRLMAEGRSNAAIARGVHVSSKTVEAHISAIFAKLGLEAAPDGHRRVQAVVAYLERVGTSLP